MTDADVRQDLGRLHRLVALHGWTDTVHTHLSARSTEDPDTAWITPFGLLFEEVTPASLVRVDASGRILDDPLGNGIHPAAWGLHGPILHARPDVGCVAHTHTVAGAAVAAWRGGLRPWSQHAMRFHGALAIHDHGGLSLETSRGPAADLGHHDAMILRHHGLLAVGSSVAHAWDTLHFLQRACEVQVALGAHGEDAPAQVAERVARQFARPEREAVIQATWAACARLVDG